MIATLLLLSGCASGPAAGEDVLEALLEDLEAAVAAVEAAAAAHHAAVLDSGDLDAIHGLEEAWPADYEALEEGMHHAMEDLAACHVGGDAMAVADAEAVLDDLHAAVQAHAEAMLALDDVAACHDEEAAHEVEVGELLGTLGGLHDAWHQAMDCEGVEHHDGTGR